MSDGHMNAQVTLRFRVRLPGDPVKAAAVLSRIRQDITAYLAESSDVTIKPNERPSIRSVGFDASLGAHEGNPSFEYQEGKHPWTNEY